MNVTSGAQPITVAAAQSQPGDNTISYHSAFCQLALPIRAAKENWSREAGGAAVTIEAPAGGVLMPSGKWLRVLLIHLFDAAIRGGNPVVEVGESAEQLAEAMRLDLKGPKLRELGEHYERLVASKITVAVDGGLPLSVFDARGRAKTSEWRTSVRLNARFFTGLQQSVVRMDRRVVHALLDAPIALDTFAWLSCALQRAEAPERVVSGWEELMQRFANASQEPEAFRTEFEEALRVVTAICPSLSVIVGDEGIKVRPGSSAAGFLAPRTPIVAMPAPEPPPAPAPAKAQVKPVTPTQRPVASAPEPAEVTPAGPRQTISLRSHLTGLNQVIWLQRANGRDNQVIEVTPGTRYDPDTRTVLALEPIVVQIAGGLYERDFERVSAWAMTNRDLIDDFWDGQIDSFSEIESRVKKVPAPGWR